MPLLALRTLRSIAIGMVALGLAWLAGLILVIFHNPIVLAAVFLVAAGAAQVGNPLNLLNPGRAT